MLPSTLQMSNSQGLVASRQPFLSGLECLHLTRVLTRVVSTRVTSFRSPSAPRRLAQDLPKW